MNGRGDSDAPSNEPWQEGSPLSVTFVSYLNMIRRGDCVTSKKVAVHDSKFVYSSRFFGGGGGPESGPKTLKLCCKMDVGRAGKRLQSVQVMMQD